VFWFEFANIADEEKRWRDMRVRMERSRIKLRAQGKLAKLPVGRTKAEVQRQFQRSLAIRHMPALNDGKDEPDESHCGIHGLPRDELDVADYVADHLVDELRPAK